MSAVTMLLQVEMLLQAFAVRAVYSLRTQLGCDKNLTQSLIDYLVYVCRDKLTCECKQKGQANLRLVEEITCCNDSANSSLVTWGH